LTDWKFECVFVWKKLLINENQSFRLFQSIEEENSLPIKQVKNEDIACVLFTLRITNGSFFTQKE